MILKYKVFTGWEYVLNPEMLLLMQLKYKVFTGLMLLIDKAFYIGQQNKNNNNYYFRKSC